MTKPYLALVVAALSIVPAFAQSGTGVAEFKTSYLQHLQTSENFTLKVADAMPAENYNFKLTPEQMSFGGQMMHLASALRYYCSSIGGEKPSKSESTATTKEEIMAQVKASFTSAIAVVQKMTPEQITKSYQGQASGSSKTGFDILLGMLDHTTNHRASAEMYLRAKGITPPQYTF